MKYLLYIDEHVLNVSMYKWFTGALLTFSPDDERPTSLLHHCIAQETYLKAS